MAMVREYQADGSSYVVMAETNAAHPVSRTPKTNEQTPNAESCLAHLKLLQAFQVLREDVSQRDNLFGIKDSFALSAGPDDQKQKEMLAKIREKRWLIYVTKAATRFEKWWDNCLLKSRSPLGHNMIAQMPPREFNVDNLPPLGSSIPFQPPCADQLRCHHGMARLPVESAVLL